MESTNIQASIHPSKLASNHPKGQSDSKVNKHLSDVHSLPVSQYLCCLWAFPAQSSSAVAPRDALFPFAASAYLSLSSLRATETTRHKKTYQVSTWVIDPLCMCLCVLKDRGHSNVRTEVKQQRAQFQTTKRWLWINRNQRIAILLFVYENCDSFGRFSQPASHM